MATLHRARTGRRQPLAAARGTAFRAGLALVLLALLALSSAACGRSDDGVEDRIPAKTVVLTFDDAVRSQLVFVAPILKKDGFGATFFITARWMGDPAHYMDWADVAQLQSMGFEIGNHSWSHLGFQSPMAARLLPSQLHRVEAALADVGVPKPISFAWPGDAFGPESLRVLRHAGYLFARRGMAPEARYGSDEIGPAYDPRVNDPLLIPSTGVAGPQWTVAHFREILARAIAGQAVVLQFHGVPDPGNAHVSTSQESFRRYMAILKEGGYHVIAVRDLARYVNPKEIPPDPMAKRRWPRETGGGDR